MIPQSVQRALSAFDLPDDRTVEDRYPKVTWAAHPGIRKAQRKCFLIAEYYAAHPEAEAPILALNRRLAAMMDGFTETGRYRDDGWSGIEHTAPAKIRATLGPQLTHGAKRGLPASE